MSDPTSYAGYGDARYLEQAAEFLREDKRLSYAAMRVQPGQRILDVGCSPGLDTVELARLVGERGEVVGVDSDAAFVAQATRCAADAGVGGWVVHLVADANALPFAPDRFDASRAERLFQHVTDPAAVLAEMVRVTRPGGWIVVLDTDYRTFSIDSEETDIERRLARLTAERSRNPNAARHLYWLFKRQRLEDVAVEIRPHHFTSYGLVRYALGLDSTEARALAEGIITEEELERWHRGLEQAEAEGAFFATVNVNLVAGRKP